MKVLIPKVTTVMCADRKKRKLTQCLIRGQKRPKTNWVVRFGLNGVPYDTEGGFWDRGIDSMASFLSEHGVDGANLIAGATCNYSWLINSKSNNQLFSPEELKKLCDEVDLNTADLPKVKASGREYRAPDKWANPLWGYAYAYLQGDVYSEEKFRWIMNENLLMLDPKVNPSRGCKECYDHFKKELTTMSIGTQGDARRWLTTVHNKVNKRKGRPQWRWKRSVSKYGWD